MPGNGVGDRVHNFFAQENLPQGLRSQDGNWPINDNLWAGNQKQFGVSDSSPRNYNSQQSESERGHGGQHVPDPHIFNITQTNARSEFARNLSQSQHEQPSSNGYMYGRHNFQTRPDEANFMGVNTEYAQNNVNQRGFPFYEAQQEPAPEQPPKNPFRPESSEAHGSFDLFGGQHQTNSQYPGLLQQPLQQQQSGFGDIQQLQQQLMLRKMQELQRQQSSLNQASQYARQQASGSHSHGLVNGTPTSDSSGYGWTEPAAANPNWLHHASQSMHPEQGQPQRSMGFVQQQVEPSLYGVPVSSSRGPITQFPHNNSFPGNSYATIPEQNMVPGKGLFGNTSGQGSNSGMKKEHVQQQIGLQNLSVQESPVEMVQDKLVADAASLDPEEEKILFGSDDNIWKAFGSSKNVSGGMSSLLDDDEFTSGLPSMQSGSWSALMQSAVAETTSGDGGGGLGVQEEWPDLNFQNPVLAHGKHPYKGSGRRQAGLSDINLPDNDKHHSNTGFQHSSGGSNWLHRGGLQKTDTEESRLYENSAPGQRMPQQHGTSQPNNKRNQFNASEPVPPSVNSGFNMNDNDTSLQQSQNNDWKRVNTAAIPNLSNLQQGGNHSNQFSPNSHHLNYRKHVDSSARSKGSENSEISQHRLNNKGPQISESSFNSSDKEDLNSSRKENSNDSYRSSSSHLNSVGQREQFSSDAGESRSLSGTKQSLSNQAGRKISGPGPRKFHYHPMGNLDEDVGVPYGTREGTNTKAVPLQHSRGLGGQDHGSFGLTKTSGQGFVPEVEGALKGSDMHFKGMIPGPVLNIFAPHDRSVGLSTSDKASQPSQSQNMLELLHKVDQSRDGGIARHLNSLERNLSSEIPEPETSDGSFGGHQRSQSSNSQGIGLQLGPPSQRLPMTMQPVKHSSLSQSQPSANSRGKGHAELSPFPPFQETSRGEFKNSRMSISGQSESQTAGHKMMTNLSAALGGTDFPNVRNQLHNHPTACNESFNGHAPQIRQADERMQVGEKLPVSHPRANSGVSQQGAFLKMLPNAWSNPQSQQFFSATQAHKRQLNIVESTSLDKQNLEEQEAEKKGNTSSLTAQGMINSVGEQSTEKVDQDQMINGPAAGNDPINTGSEKDLEAFGLSLKPNNFEQQISLLNQMKAYKHADNDPNNRVMKRLKESDKLLHAQQVTVQLGNPEIPRPTVPAENVDRSLASLSANPRSKDVLASDQNQIGPTSVKIENSHISPQMAPSWFDQYGTFKGGQMLSQRANAVRTVEQPFKVSGSLETTTHDAKEPPASGVANDSQGGVIWKTPSVPSSLVADHQLTSPPLKTSINVQNLVIARPKKQKWSRDDIHSWLKEVSGSSKNVQGIRTASMEWCEATKRLMEKVGDGGELIEDVPRPKRRIILSTQLMHQLFPPPPSTLFSTDATLDYESLAFYAARLALGDACNLVSCVSHSESNLLSDRSRESERITDKRLSEAVEDYTSKAKRVENDFSSLDKRASILDLRVECQDLDKFGMINRFAKFHGRGQADGEGSSVSDTTVANASKAAPQRYVIAVKMPKNLPERVQCLSL